ncbi:SPFH domain-containing protein [Streptomyces sp. NPDC023327]|uniref:SPFH domain-containing protein n=3 Tax=unclassified Streptomyces TaxID=2593676 RepID=UPI0033E4851D
MSATAASQPQSPRPGGAPEQAAARPPRVIQSEATTEIPVHLLFRDDPDDPVAVPLPPAVVRRRRGTGEQPRTPRRPAPTPAPASEAGPAESAARPVPDLDPSLAERRARVLPGLAGVLGGCAGVAGCTLSLWWAGMLPEPALRAAGLDGGGTGPGPAQWASLAASGTLGLFGFGGLARGRVGRAWVLSLFGRYRGTVRRTGLLWVNPLLLRRRVDVRLRHWRSEPMPAVDRDGVALRVVVLVVWRVKDPARATLAVEDHQEYLRECVEAATARVLSRLPADAFHDDAPALRDAPTLRDADAVGAALTRALAADVEAVGVEVFSARPTRIEYAPEVAAAMRRRRVAALDARHRDTVLTSVVDSVEDTVTRLTTRGLVELDDYERKALVKDLTVAFYTGHGEHR